MNELAVDVVERGGRPRRGAVACELDYNISFDTEILESFSSANWQAVVYDALVVAATVEFCDRSLSRSAMNWGRRFDIRIPVHDPARWSNRSVMRALIDALNLLTGDNWNFEFRARRTSVATPAQNRMMFPNDAEAVIAYSEGMDSRAVDGLVRMRLGHRLVRVRVGTKRQDIPKKTLSHVPFAALPYKVKLDGNNAETSARSRGFKFSVVSALAAYLIDAPSIIVPESGQGALAPAILPVGQGYSDYRNHPVFAVLMEKFVSVLLGHRLRYSFPQLWKTKGETLREFIDNCGEGVANWAKTRSCWQQSRQASVSGTWRQCGICAACMLRRMSVHAAGLNEPRETYVWETLKSPTFAEGAAQGFNKMTSALREYALAGVLHLEHFALIRTSAQHAMLKRRTVSELTRSLAEPPEMVASGLERLMQRHSAEWSAFTRDLGEGSFVRKWIDTVQ
ncbi:7-cyano-7-deazaguanine synthase [Bradyrhizobium japonicum]|nr:7-cyano-7-deazaguanine synthase [Bradyrhizobium japonicum]